MKNKVTTSLLRRVFMVALGVVLVASSAILPSGANRASAESLPWYDFSSSNYGNLEDVAYGNGMWVAVGQEGSVVTSTDGMKWTRSSLSNNELLGVYDIEYLNNTWIAVGEYGVIYTSSDADEWSTRQNANPTQPTLTSVTLGMDNSNNPLYVAVGDNGKGYRSSDTVTWTPLTVTDAGNSELDITYADNKFVVVSQGGAPNPSTVSTATYDLEWSSLPLNHSSAGVIYQPNSLPGEFISASSTANEIYTSPDGTTWTPKPFNPDFLGDYQFVDITYNTFSSEVLMLRQNLEGASTETPSTLVAYDDGYFYEEVITNKTGTKLKAAAAHNSIAVAVGVNGAIFVRGVFPSEENDVTSLTLTNATLEPEFDSNIITYHATPIANATSVGVEVNVSKYATFTINGVPAENGVSVPVPLTNPGQIGNVEIVVTPQYGGVTKTYKISIAADRTAQLTSLAISQGILEPQFSSTVFSYYAQVESDIDKLNLTAIKRDVNATMTIASNGGTPQPLTSDTPISLALQEGWNGFQIVVTSPTDTKTYTVSVTRFYSADLSNLTVNPGTLVPAFDPKRTDYTVSVANSVSTIAVTPTAKSKSAAIMVNGRETVSGEVYNMPLQEGRNEVKIVVTNQTFNPTSIENVISTQALPKTEKVYTVIVNRAGTETSNPTPTPSNPVPTTPAPVTPAPTTPTTPANGLEVLVNGQPTTVVATGGPSQVNGQTVFNATIDTTRLTTFLASTQGNPTVTIPVRVESDRILANMTAEAAALLISRNATLRVESPLGNYTLPSSQIRLGTVANTLGVAPGSASLNLNVVIEKSNTQVQNALNQAVANGGFTIASQPIDFMITASVGDRTVEVNSFTQYVEREIPLPTGTNSNQVTTAVVIEQNGTLRHVPTEVTRSGDNDYARVNSLTNSSYALIWNPKQFSDVAGKWSQASVNDMASRLIVNGVGGDRYNPEGAVTRAEFSAILVRALGLPTSTQSNTFSDVSSSDWYAGAASTANAYGLITGYPDGTFRPNATITRQEAFAILDRATQIVPLQSSDNATELSSYRDQANVASWARTSTQAILAAGLAEGNSGWLRPEATLSRAESAAVAQRLLQQSNLID